jgi:hypothetical protein
VKRLGTYPIRVVRTTPSSVTAVAEAGADAARPASGGGEGSSGGVRIQADFTELAREAQRFL